MLSRLAVVLCIFVALFVPSATHAAFFTEDKPTNVKATLVAIESSVQPGRAFTVALKLEHQPGWHTYWKYPGTGLPTSLKWELPPGWTAGDIQWPTPAKIIDDKGTITGNGYTGIVYLPVTLTPPVGLKPGESVTLKATADWLMCNKECVPGSAKVELTLPVSAEKPVAVPDANGMAVATASAALPRAADGWRAEVTQTGKILSLRLTAPAGAPAPRAPWFFGDQDFVAYDAPQEFHEEQPGVYIFKLALSAAAETGVKRLTGVLYTESSWAATGKPALTGWVIDLPLILAATLPAESANLTSLLGTLGLALLGGLILNLMPCVFPVLGIKILGFVHQSGADRRKVVQHGFVFTAGVLLSFWSLAGVLAALRAGGEQLGWGFQLQSPGFVFTLAAVMLVFALNLSGVFEFGLGATGVGGSLQTKTGYAGSFFTGVLATVVATPCSAPFLAPALGAALALPTGQSFLVFTAIGVGLSAPYLLLSIFPSAVKWLPRPGAWMETFKQFMAFPLYATVGALVWVLVGQVGDVAQRNAIFGLTAVAMAAWCYGRFAQAGPTGARVTRARLGVVGAVALLAFGGWLGWPQAAAGDELTWEPWSAERVAALRAEGRTIYVDFTARWCATCQTNKKIVFGSAEVRRVFKEKKIATLRADWTNKDAKIAEELARWGRAAVPFDLVYLPGAAEGKPLPEVLTPGLVLEALGK